MNAFTHLLVASCLAVAAAANAEESGRESTNLAAQLAEEAGPRQLFEMCCWARGRAGFHHCAEYGICESDPEATCKGVGAAEGLTMSCSTAPPSEEKQGG